MLVTNHVLSGAALGAAIRRPLPAFAAGVVSHFVLDAVPHWGKWGSDKAFLRVAVADGLTGLGVMAAVTRLASTSGSAALPQSVLAGMAGAALPDLDKPSAVLLHHTLWPAKVNDFHAAVQAEAPHRFFSHELVAAAAFALSAVTLIRRAVR